MFERFTEPARQVVVLAQDEARTLQHNYIGTEHILLGLLREEDGIAARALESLGITIEEVRGQVARIVGRGDEVPHGQIPFTPRAKKVLELALREALSLGHQYIGTEHLLLGLGRENEGVAMRILSAFGANAEKIRNEIIRALSAPRRPADPRLVSELESIAREKEAALEAQQFERAAMLRDRERSLQRRLSGGQSELREGGWEDVTIGGRRSLAEHVLEGTPLLFGWMLFGVALGIGVLVGWLIWG